jgi:hypothetical protein
MLNEQGAAQFFLRQLLAKDSLRKEVLAHRVLEG